MVRRLLLAVALALPSVALMSVGCSSSAPETAEVDESEEDASEEESGEAEAPEEKPASTKAAPSKTAPKAAGDGPEILETKTYDPATLPKLEEEPTSMDGGKFSMRAPEGWKLGSKQTGIVFRLYKQDKTGLPRLMVKASDDAGPATTAENVAEYAEKVRAGLGSLKVTEDIRPMVLGPNAWVRVVDERKHQPPGAPEPIKVEVQSLHTIQNGRHYILELQTKQGELENPDSTDRNDAYALAAGIEFKK